MTKKTPPLTHFTSSGAAQIVDVSAKPATTREATATATITMHPDTLALVQQGSAKKGDVLGIARLAGIMAAKKTPELIPLCHAVALTHITVDFAPSKNPSAPTKTTTKNPSKTTENPASITITARARTHAQTGVEMEALTAAAIAALAIYDMLKAADKGMCIGAVRLLKKTGGSSGDWVAESDAAK